MKRSKIAAVVMMSLFMTAGIFMGCPNLPGSNPGGTENPDNPGNPSGKTLQEQIENTQEGKSVTLDASLVGEGKEIKIEKAITVDGNNIEGLTVKVSSDVAEGVTLKNFKKADITVEAKNTSSPASSINFARGVDVEVAGDDDDDEESLKSFKKFGDGAASLKLEGCEISSFTTLADIALYMGSGDSKSVIDSLLLKKGAEDFTFVEFDEKDTAKADKSEVKELVIDNGVKEINLIGGTFGGVDFADGVTTAAVDFKYDKEFEEDQLAFEKKDEFFADKKIEARDIALADDKVEENYTGLGKGYFMFTMSKDDFSALNGYMDILFLTDDQANAWVNGGFDDSVTFESPAYDMSLMGPFTVETAEDGSIEDGLYAIYGSSKTYRNYFTPDNYRRITLEKYMTYSKEAVVVEIKGDVAIIYVNKGAIRKSDLLMCSGWRKDTTDDNVTGTCEGGSKLSEVSLEGYYPYFAIGMDSYRGDETTLFSTLSCTPISPEALCLPVSSKQDFPQCYKLYRVTDSAEYPDVSSVEYPDIAVPTTKVTVKYYDSTLTTCTKTEDAVVKENINAKDDGVEYYFDSDFTQILFSDDPDGNIEEWLWDQFYEVYDLSKESDLVLYARPKRTINFTLIAGMEGMAVTDITQLYPADSYFALTTGETTVRLYKTAAEATDTALESFSNEITSLKDIEDNSTVYVVIPYVNLYAIGAEEGSPVLSLGKTLVSLLFTFDQNMTNVLRADFYSAATVSDANKYTMETIGAVAPASKVYTTSPDVEIYEEYVASASEPITTVPFADFYAEVSSTSTTQKYYRMTSGDLSTAEPYEIKKEDLDEYLASDGFYFDLNYPVYKNFPAKINVMWINHDWLTESEKVLKSELIKNKNRYEFYSDEGKSKKLSDDEVEALEHGDTVYVYDRFYVSIKVHEYTNMWDGDNQKYIYCFDEEAVSSMTKEAWVDGSNKYQFYTPYKDSEMTQKLTLDDIIALPENADVYVKSVFVDYCEEYHGFDGEDDSWGLISKVAVGQVLYDYYVNIHSSDLDSKTVYKSQDKTAVYTKDELLALTEDSDVVLYIGFVSTKE